MEKKENGCLGALRRVFFFHVEKKENGCFRANLTAVILNKERARNWRGRAKNGGVQGCERRRRKTLVFGGCERASRAK